MDAGQTGFARKEECIKLLQQVNDKSWGLSKRMEESVLQLNIKFEAQITRKDFVAFFAAWALITKKQDGLKAQQDLELILKGTNPNQVRISVQNLVKYVLRHHYPGGLKE